MTFLIHVAIIIVLSVVWVSIFIPFISVIAFRMSDKEEELYNE